MVTATLPPEGANVTGTPAHVRKTLRAVALGGAEATLVELEVDRVHLPLRLARTLVHAWRALRAARPDVLHVHGHIAAATVLPVARALGLPVLLEVHGLYVASKRASPGTRPLLSRLAGLAELPVIRRADHVIAQALAMRDRLSAAGVAPERLTVLYPGLRTAEFSDYDGPPADVPGAAPGERIVLYVGSTHAYQGLDLLAAAQRHLPTGFRVVLVLSSDAGPPADVVARFGFDPARTTAVHPAGPGELPAWCRRADVLVHARPDVPDNVNVQSKLGLYLASGRPVAATRVGDSEALLGGSRGCVLSDPEPAPFAAAVVAAASKEVAASAAHQNPALARRHFEAEANARQLVELYRVLAARRGRPWGQP
jgi:glycosyltransferase involved in cell wall biosynthesis